MDHGSLHQPTFLPLAVESCPEVWNFSSYNITVKGPGIDTPCTWQLSQPYLIIGSAPGTGLVLPNKKIRRRHAYLHITETGIFFVDLLEGTSSQYDRTPPLDRWFSDGEILKLGSYELHFACLSKTASKEVLNNRIPLSSKITRPTSLPELCIESSGGKKARRQIKRPLTVIGKSKSAHLRLIHGSISEFHAVVVCEQESIWTVDLGSRKGTKQNQQPIDIARLSEKNASVSLGQINLTVASHNVIEPPSSPPASSIDSLSSELNNSEPDIPGAHSQTAFASKAVMENLRGLQERCDQLQHSIHQLQKPPETGTENKNPERKNSDFLSDIQDQVNHLSYQMTDLRNEQEQQPQAVLTRLSSVENKLSLLKDLIHKYEDKQIEKDSFLEPFNKRFVDLESLINQMHTSTSDRLDLIETSQQDLQHLHSQENVDTQSLQQELKTINRQLENLPDTIQQHTHQLSNKIDDAFQLINSLQDQVVNAAEHHNTLKKQLSEEITKIQEHMDRIENTTLELTHNVEKAGETRILEKDFIESQEKTRQLQVDLEQRVRLLEQQEQALENQWHDRQERYHRESTASEMDRSLMEHRQQEIFDNVLQINEDISQITAKQSTQQTQLFQIQQELQDQLDDRTDHLGRYQQVIEDLQTQSARHEVEMGQVELRITGATERLKHLFQMAVEHQNNREEVLESCPTDIPLSDVPDIEKNTDLTSSLLSTPESNLNAESLTSNQPDRDLSLQANSSPLESASPFPDQPAPESPEADRSFDSSDQEWSSPPNSKAVSDSQSLMTGIDYVLDQHDRFMSTNPVTEDLRKPALAGRRPFRRYLYLTTLSIAALMGTLFLYSRPFQSNTRRLWETCAEWINQVFQS